MGSILSQKNRMTLSAFSERMNRRGVITWLKSTVGATGNRILPVLGQGIGFVGGVGGLHHFWEYYQDKKCAKTS